MYIPVPDDCAGILGPRWGGIFDPISTPRVGSLEGKIGDEKIASDWEPKTSTIIRNGYIPLSDDFAGILVPGIDRDFRPYLASLTFGSTLRAGSFEREIGDEKTASDRRPKTGKIIGNGYVTSILLFIMFLESPIHATDPHQKPSIKILSEQMECDHEKKICVAKGNAVAEKLNEPKTKILKADEITAHFAKEGGTGPLEITHLEATGNVFFVIGDIIAQGKRGNYDVEQEIAEVFDDVKVTNDENQLDGSYGKVNMRTGRYFINSNKGRVQALIFTKEAKKDKDHTQNE